MAEGYVGVRARDLEAAARSQEKCAELLVRLAHQPPSPGLSPSLLMIFSRLASPSCQWLDGDLAVELFAEENATRVRVMSELGGGQRERVLPPVSVPSNLEELTSAAERSPALLGPLRLERVSSRCVFLVSSEEPPTSAEFPISESCLSEKDDDVDDERWLDSN